MNGDECNEDGLTPEERRRRRQQRRADDSADAVDHVELIGEASGGDSGFAGSGGRGSGGRADTGSVPGSRGPGSSAQGSGVPDGGPGQGGGSATGFGSSSGPNSGGGSHAGGGDVRARGGLSDGCDCDLPCGCDVLLLRLSALLWLAAVLVPARAGTRPVLALLWAYRRWLTRFTPRCPSSPSCSSYALDAVQTLGARRGLAAAARRVRDCGHPAG